MNAITLALTRIRSIRLDIALPTTIFLIPLIVSGPQILTGTLVNCLLFLSATEISRKKLWFMVTLPSIGALAHGALFGPFTVFLVYLLPLIWISNAVMVWTYTIGKHHFSPTFSVLMSATLKAAALYLATSFFVMFKIVPSSMLAPMGIMQFVTAIVGGIIALKLVPLIHKTV